MTLMEQNDPNNLTDAVRDTLKKRFQEIMNSMETGRCRLKELEPELEQYTSRLESVYERIDDGLFFLTMAMRSRFTNSLICVASLVAHNF